MARHEASPTPPRRPDTQPAPLTPAWLRAHFDPLPFPARMSALARYARTLTPHAYETLRHALDAGDAGERHTALFLAVVRRDLDRVSQALDDPLLGRRARAAAIRLPVPETALESLALSDVRAIRRDTYRLLALSRRGELAARLLPTVHERHGPREAAALLPACPAETVSAWLPRVEPGPGTLNSLARTAPRAVARLLAAQRGRQGHRQAYGFVNRHRAVASFAARRDPDAALVLLARAPDLLTPLGVRAVLYRPAEALTVLRAARPDAEGRRPQRSIPAGPLPPALRRILRGLPVEDLVALAGCCPATGSRERGPRRHDVAPDGLLRLLPPAERRRVVAARAESGRGLRGAPLTTFAALEPDDRAALLLPRVEKSARSPWGRARLAVALPLADGEPLLRDLADNHRADHRAVAWPALLACAELEGDPEQFARVALDCERAWHDRDEVRGAALRQLAGVTPRLLSALPDRVLRDAVLTTVQSRDSTAATLGAAERLLYRVVQRAVAQGRAERAAYAVGLLGEFVAEPRHTSSLTPLRAGEEGARAVWAASSRTGTVRRPATVIALAELLAPHVAALPALDAEVREIAVRGEHPRLVARAAAAWVQPAHLREQRCGDLLALDPSFATVPLIQRTVATRRTDLLDLVIAAAEDGTTGRLRTRTATPWTPQLSPHVTGRWLPAQVEAWHTHHARVAGDDTAPLHVRARAVKFLGHPARLAALADEAPQPVAAAALVALGESTGQPGADAPVLRDLLLRHAATGGVRGRAATAALRRLLDRLPDGDAVQVLGSVAATVDAPVGGRKEAARALGALPGKDAFEALVTAWDRPGQHPDVRAALAGALLPRIDRAAVADRLLGAVHEPAVRDTVVHARVQMVSDAAAMAYTGFLTRLVEEGDEDTVVAACAVLPSWSAGQASVLAGLVTDAGRPRKVWQAAARGLLGTPPGPTAVDAFRTLAARARDPRERVDALWRLHACVDALHPHQTVHTAPRVVEALVDALEEAGLHADAARLGWDTALDSVRHGEHDQVRWERLLRLCETAPGRLPATQHVSVDFHPAHVRAAALTTARFLRARGTGVAGSLALRLVQGVGRAADWDEPWRAELDALRAYPDPDTAMEALLVDPDGAR
ncbi:hypothetical protein [Streptomyces sp. DH24]|uniref:hypothetical protein n=1 Tax=Streptomyces sp. DH24 TaxID=3040123 RepID=UPI0024414A54|nr:hypothetical protein [Streptomyces sp. DH24]MDG9715597.1 hypothetical protein [Streptomyces sp. DH24]